jgi:hypothetical protein
MLSLSAIKNGLPHSVKAQIYKGECVRCRDPEANYQLKWKNRRRTLAIFPHGDDIRVHCFAGQDYIRVKEWARSQLGVVWKPKPKAWKPSPASIRLLSETIRICETYGANDALFAILVSDYRLAGHDDKDAVRAFVTFLGKPEADFERAWAKKPRIYRAAERAAAHGLTHAQFQHLDLRMSGCAEKTPEERRRITRDKENTRRRVKRAEARELSLRVALRVATVRLPSLEQHITTTVTIGHKDSRTWIKPRNSLKASKFIKIGAEIWQRRGMDREKMSKMRWDRANGHDRMRHRGRWSVLDEREAELRRAERAEPLAGETRKEAQLRAWAAESWRLRKQGHF